MSQGQERLSEGHLRPNFFVDMISSPDSDPMDVRGSLGLKVIGRKE